MRLEMFKGLALFFVMVLAVVFLAGCATTNGTTPLPDKEKCAQARAYIKVLDAEMVALNKVPVLKRDKTWRETYQWYQVARIGAVAGMTAACGAP